MKLLLIRHAETNTNLKGIMHITNDPVGLSSGGVKQANNLISIAKFYEIDSIYTSPEVRAIETTKIIADGLLKPYSVLEGLRERDWGEWEGKAWTDIKSYLDEMSLQKRYVFIPPGGESWKDMEQRLSDAIKQITTIDKGNAVVITHEGALRAIVTLLNRAPKESSFNLHFANASTSIFEYKNNNFTQLILNDTSHLKTAS